MDSKILREATLAYQAVYDENLRQELTEKKVWEEVETWVNSLLEEGYDLSDYTWEEMYEEYINEQGRGASVGSNPNISQNPIAKAIRGDGPSPTMTPAQRNQARMRPGTPSAKPQVSTTQVKPAPTPAAKPKFGTTTPKGSSVTSTGVTGLSAADRAAYSAGGGNAAAQKGMGKSTADVIKQGKLNLSKMDQGKRAPAGAKPTSGPSSVNPKTGLSAGPATKPAAAAKPTAAPVAKPTAPAAAKPTAPAAKPAGSAMDQFAKANPKLAASAAERDRTRGTSATTNPLMKDMKANLPAPKSPAPSTAKTGFDLAKKGVNLAASVDIFDLVKGHLLDEGYADNEDAALAIMANMSEEWKQSIVEMSPAMQNLLSRPSNRLDGKRSPASGGGQSSTSGAARPAQPQRPQPPGGLTPMQRLQRRPDPTIR